MNMKNQEKATKIRMKYLENNIDKINAKIDNYSKNKTNLTQSQRDDLEHDLRKLYGQLNSLIGIEHNRKRMNKPARKRKKSSKTNLLLGFIVNADRMVTSLNDIVTAKVESNFLTKEVKKAEMKRTVEAIQTCYEKPQRSWDYFKSV